MKVASIERQICSILTISVLILAGILILTPSILLDNNASALSELCEVSDRDFNNGTLINLTTISDGLESELQLLSENEEWIRKWAPTKPAPRFCHAMASIHGTDKIVLFAGSENNNDETWVYDLSDNNWVEKEMGIKPSARYDHAMATVYGSGDVVLFGGKNVGGYLDDTWVYNLTSDSWIDKRPSTNPIPRRNHAMASIWGTDKVMLFGGSVYKNHQKYDDTWIYDLSNNTWTQQKPSTKPKTNHVHAMSSIWGTDKVLMFGGTNGNNNTWVYDLSDNKWTLQKPIVRPSSRYCHAMASVWNTDKVIMYGGWDDNKSPNRCWDDTWVYDLSDDNWSQRKPGIKPGERYLHTMAPIWGQDKVVLFGGIYYGITNSNCQLFDDTWVFTPTVYYKYVNGTYISKGHDTGSQSSFRTLSWVAITPIDTEIKLQIRTAEDEYDLDTAPFLGPDGTTSTYYTTQHSTIASVHYGDRWVQYKVDFITDNLIVTARLEDVWIAYNCIPETRLISPLTGSILTTSKPDLTWNFTDLDSSRQVSFQVLIDNEVTFEDVEYDSGEQETDAQHWQFPNGTDYNELPDGTWYWKVRTRDNEGDWSPYCKPWELIIDVTPPTSKINVPLNNGVYYTVDAISGTASDPPGGVGLDEVELSIKRVRDDHYWTGFRWDDSEQWLLTEGTHAWTYSTMKVKWTSCTQYITQSRATDNATNIEIPGDNVSFYIDRDSPLSLVENPLNNSYVNSLDTILGSACDVGEAGVKSVDILVQQSDEKYCWDGTSWKLGKYWVRTEGTEAWYYNSSGVGWITDTYYNIRSMAVDNISNIEKPGAGNTFMYDDQPPGISILINDGEIYTNKSTVSLALSAHDTGSGVDGTALKHDSTIWSNWEASCAAVTYTLHEGDGNKIIYYRAKDRAGNIAEPLGDSIILDTTPPEELSIAINDNAVYTNDPVVSLDLFAVDKLSGLHQMAFSFDGISWDRWETFDYTKLIRLPDGDGKKTIYFKVNDKAGNYAVTSDTIILDIHPPHSLKILINRGADVVSTPTVVLMLDAKDDTSGVHRMSFCTDDGTWSSWEYFSESKLYLLTESSSRLTIYYKVVDRAGNVADPVAATIQYDGKSDGSGTGTGSGTGPTNPDIDDNKPGADFQDLASRISISVFSIIGIVLVLIIITVLTKAVYIYRKKRRRQAEVIEVTPLAE